jgi:hypothetical protein
MTNLQSHKSFQVFRALGHFLNNIDYLAALHSGGLRVGSSNLPAPTNMIKHLSFRTLPLGTS